VLGVLDHQHHRLHRGEPFEEQPPPREQLLPRERGGAVRRGRDAEQPTQPRRHVVPLAGIRDELFQPLVELGRCGFGRVLLRDAQPLADDLG